MTNILDSATGPGNIDDILTSTLTNRMNSGSVKDQIFNEYPVLYWMNKNGNKMTVNGGEKIVVDLEYDENSTAGFYSDYEVIGTTPTETLSQALFDPITVAASITISTKDEAKNQASPQRIIDLLEHRRKNAVKSLEHTMSQALFNSAPTAKLPWSLPEIVSASDPSRGNLGLIDRDTYTFWQAQSTTLGSFAASGLSAMKLIKRQCSASAGSQGPDLIVFGETSFGYFENTVEPQYRYSDRSMAEAAFETLKLGKTTAVWDKDAPNTSIFFLNKEAIKLSCYKGYDMRVTPFVKPNNQLTRTAQILSIYNVVACNPRRLGVLTGVTA